MGPLQVDGVVFVAGFVVFAEGFAGGLEGESNSKLETRKSKREIGSRERLS
jgi:hypothetical protein